MSRTAEALHRTLPRDASAVALARREVEAHAGALSAEQLDVARLLVSELVTNAVRHGTGEQVVLALRLEARRARFEVHDEGAAGAARRRATGADGGYGLNLVASLASRWGAGPDTGVWFELDRERDGGAGADGHGPPNARERAITAAGAAPNGAVARLLAVHDPSAAARQLGAVLDALAEAVTVSDERGRVVYANEAAVRLLRLESAAQLIDAEPGETMARFDVYDEEGAPVRLEQLPGARVRAGEPSPGPLLVRNLVKATGEERWLLNKATAICDGQGRVARVVNVIEDVTEAKRAEIGQRLLAEASDALVTSLDREATLRRVAQLLVPRFADWCAIDLPAAGDAVRTVAVAPAGAGTAPAAPAGDAARLVVPLAAGGERLGLMTLARTRPGQAFDDADARIAEELGRRAGAAVLNARVYGERSAIAATLQRGLRPPELQAPAGFALATHYEAAGRENEVGGDFYDAFATPRGWMLVIGDVAGHGAEAAALTALARYTLRAAGQLMRAPDGAARHLNATLRDLPQLSICTAVCAHLRVAEGGAAAELTFANCGHPRPLLLRDGRAEEVGDVSPIAGAFDDGDWSCTATTLRPGDLLLLYTDGVLEAVGAHERFGAARLRAAVEGCPAAEPEAVVARVAGALDAFRAGPQRDDTAIVALRFAGGA